MLEDFLLLAVGDAETVAAYAQKWGTLNICRHGCPMTHIPERVWLALDSDEQGPCGVGWTTRRGSDPLERWRHYAAQAVAVLTIAEALSHRSPRAIVGDLWTTLDDLYPFDVASVVAVTPSVDAGAAQRRLLASALQEWLRLGGVEVAFDWVGVRPQLSLGGGSLFGALAMQLVLAVAGVDGFALCDECGLPFLPKRRNRPGVPRRCPEHRDVVPKREYARRKAAERRGEA
jgi:hypothetical protein